MRICFFKGVWRHPANPTVRTDCIVIGFNVSKDGGFCRQTGIEVLKMHEFILQTVKEIFSNCIIVGIAASQHTLAYMVL